LLRVCEEHPRAGDLARLCVVRDVRSRVRLIVEPREAVGAAALDTILNDLRARLVTALGRYFAPPILATVVTEQNPLDSVRVAVSVMNAAPPWDNASYEDLTGGRITAPERRFRLLERRLSKQTWLEKAKPEEAWPLTQDKPAIVTFYSFKGGVGRTTALAACAWQLAREGHHVAVVDLDLEAPGLGPLFGSTSQRGVLDALVDTLAGVPPRDLTPYMAPAHALGPDDARNVTVFPAGNLDETYLEKLARLDFVARGSLGDDAPSEVERALRILLKIIAGKLRPRPAYILLDSRAGLHDIAGLSLHGLAHVDVLVSRASEQAYQGFDITVRSLGQRKDPRQMRCLVVHSFAPRPRDEQLLSAERAQFLARSHQSFERHVYDDNAPMLDDADAPHHPIVLHQDENLERFSSLGVVEERLFSRPFVELKKRLVALSRPEPATPLELE
jgi:MinD-like ATPase involved in chromosome partitioning or flagellar assembly